MSSTRRSDGPRIRGKFVRNRGVVAVVVLLVIAVALATSYAAMRSQTTTLNVRQNAMLEVSARRAALTGLTAGLRELHSPDWGGVDTTFSQSLNSNTSFSVQFIAGDNTLTEADADYNEYPYRVTLQVTGTAKDPTDSRRVSEHSIRAVARLILRAMPDEPSDWSTMQDYVFYQTKKHNTTLDIPARIEGKVRLQGTLRLGYHYPDDWTAWINYFYHLNQMRWNGYSDCRPVTGRIDFDYDQQDPYVYQLLGTYLSVSMSHVENDTANADWTKPTSLSTYRLFPGGPEYSIPTVSGTIQNRTLGESVTTNPLGLYYASSAVTLGDNVTVRGTLFCADDIRIDGTNVEFQSVEAPPLFGTSLPIRLPVATCRDFEVLADAECEINGLLAAFDDIEVERGSPRGQLKISGRAVAADLDICEDEAWDTLDWEQQFDTYLAVSGPTWIYFPVWMQIFGYEYTPTVQIKSGSDAQYHWYRPGETVFVPHTDDFSEMDADETPGLRWELIEIDNG